MVSWFIGAYTWVTRALTDKWYHLYKTVALLKLGYGSIIRSHILQGPWLLCQAQISINLCWWKRPQTSLFYARNRPQGHRWLEICLISRTRFVLSDVAWQNDTKDSLEYPAVQFIVEIANIYRISIRLMTIQTSSWCWGNSWPGQIRFWYGRYRQKTYLYLNSMA